MAHLPPAAVVSGGERGGQLGRLDLPGVHLQQKPGRSRRVLGMDERHQPVVGHHEDGAVLAVPHLPPAAEHTIVHSISIPATGKTPLFNQAAKAATHVQGVSWPPFMTYFLALTTTSNILNGKGTMAQDFQTLQSTMTSYAKQQGFTVSS